MEQSENESENMDDCDEVQDKAGAVAKAVSEIRVTNILKKATNVVDEKPTPISKEQSDDNKGSNEIISAEEISVEVASNVDE